MNQNRGLFICGPKKLELRDLPVPEPKENEVQIEVLRVGLCGTDMHLFREGSCIGQPLVDPIIIGHELVGRVTKGSSDTLSVGDLVTCEGAITCMKCDFCRRGHYNLCNHIKGMATPPTNGAITNYLCWPVKWTYKIPDWVDLDEAAMLEPLAVAVHTVRRVKIRTGDNVLISGTGPIGLLCLAVCRAIGVTSVTMTDISESRLNFAKSYGATHTVHIEKGETYAAIAQKAVRANGIPFSKCLECSGTAFGINACILASLNGSTVGMVGLPPKFDGIELLSMMVREVNLIGVMRYLYTFKPAIELLASGKINLKPLVTHKFKLDKAIEAFETLSNPKADAVKVVVNLEGN